MISRKSSYSTSSSSCSSFSGGSSTYQSSTPTDDSNDDDDDDDTMSSHNYAPTRPLSVAQSTATSSAPGAPGLRRPPTLREILSNTSPAPWTLAAFMAYLSTNHCLETLEFTMDAGRYRKHYEKMLSRVGPNGVPASKDRDYVRALWQKLVDAYIRPSGSREVNLPSDVRDPILNLRVSDWPPAPDCLDQAVVKIYELMEDSVLVPFINNMYHQSSRAGTAAYRYDMPEGVQQVSRSVADREVRQQRISPHSRSLEPRVNSQAYSHHRQSAPSTLSTSFPRTLFSAKMLPTSSSPTGGPAASTDTPAATSDAALTHVDSGPSMTDDSGSASASNEILMTPPTSPPVSDSSPKRDSGMWKKLRLGKKRKSQGALWEEGP